MDRIVFLNGAFVRLEEARISIMDRGFLFADGVYEVSGILDGALIDNENHLDRLGRSLREIRIPNPYANAQWEQHQGELVRRNGVDEGMLFIEVTRGVAERDFAFAALSPTVVMFTQAKTIAETPLAITGARVITVPDIRWSRRDIKSVGLLAQVMARQEAVEAGAAEAFMVEDGFITEGAASTAFIITKGNVVVTRPLSTAILAGITRRAVMKLAHEHRLTVEERPFTTKEAVGAAEVFYTSASSLVMPVVAIDERPIGNGFPGPLVPKLRALYIDLARNRGGSGL